MPPALRSLLTCLMCWSRLSVVLGGSQYVGAWSNLTGLVGQLAVGQYDGTLSSLRRNYYNGHYFY